MTAPDDEAAGSGTQDEVLDFLLRPESWGAGTGRVEHVETHGAHVVLAGERALKIKRAVRFSYMDFSTLALREAACRRELEVNRAFAPDIYRRVVAITREADGRLAIGGAGAAVEWAVDMRRFDRAGLLSRVAAAGPLQPSLVKQLAAAAHDAHARAAVKPGVDWGASVLAIIDEVTGPLRATPDAGLATKASALATRLGEALGRQRGLLQRRAADGHVRRCHGDLHLNNVVLVDGVPTLFDALEFDETLATIDTLYDLAFLLMDLDAAGQHAAANLLLSHYLWLAGDTAELEALAAMPLYLALRAAIRALVGMQRAALAKGEASGHGLGPEDYLDRALKHLAPAAPRLVAVGGYSGTGKSTLAAALAPALGGSLGALHLRSDLERKRLLGVGETERLPQAAYAQAERTAVYARLVERAGAALDAGHSVVVDAVYAGPAERAAIEDVARRAGAAFSGMWLEAAVAVLQARVGARRGDASDATPEVAATQAARGAGAMTWARVDASGAPQQTLAAARLLLGI